MTTRIAQRGAWMLALLACGVAGGSACRKVPNLSFVLNLPEDALQSAAWLEVGAYEGSSCARIANELGDGIPLGGATTRVAFRRDDTAPPSVGEVPRGRYAFAAVAKDASCGVIASGCADIDVDGASSVTISLNDVSTVTGQCESGLACVDGTCAPAIDPSDPSVGAGCSLEWIGAGPLADPLDFGGGTIVSAPAITATPDGFLIAYREYDSVEGIARLTTIPIDNGGGAGTPQLFTLPNRCTQSEESDGTAIAFNGSTGLVALARQPCAAPGGDDLFLVNTDGTIPDAGFEFVQAGDITTRPNFATAHALAPFPSGDYLLAQQVFEADMLNAHVSDVNAGFSTYTFNPSTNVTSAIVAASSDLVALVSIAGAGGGDAGIDEDAGTGSASVQLLTPAALANAGNDANYTFDAAWVSASVAGGEAIVASDAPNDSVQFFVFDSVGSTSPAQQGSFADTAPVNFADVALANDRAVFAVERDGGISLVVYDSISESPTPLRNVDLTADPRVPALTSVRDGKLAVAVSSTRAVVVWATQKTLGSSDAVGGYAMYACAK